MQLGLTRIENAIVRDILRKYKNDYSFYYYGSRVKGTYTKSSDLDILVKGETEMPSKTISELRERCDLSNLGFIVNFTDYNKIDKSSYNLIKDDLVDIFED